jgi:hypothetical protein
LERRAALNLPAIALGAQVVTGLIVDHCVADASESSKVVERCPT